MVLRYVFSQLVTWQAEIVPLAVQSYFAVLLGSFGVEIVPFAVINSHLRNPNLDVPRPQIQMQVKMAAKHFHSKEMSVLNFPI